MPNKKMKRAEDEKELQKVVIKCKSLTAYF